MTNTQIIQALQANVGQDSFQAVFAQAQQLPRIDLLAVAREFSGVRPTSRRNALARIWARHQANLMFQARRRATAGRVAA